MAEMKRKPHENIDRVLRRFKRQVKDEGIIDKLRSKEFYEKPSEVKKQRDAAARRRNYAKQKDAEW
jgi:small subunit ribosomal protein S21